MRLPVIDGIEEHDPTGRIEEHDFLESGPHDREPPGFEPDTSRSRPPRRPKHTVEAPLRHIDGLSVTYLARRPVRGPMPSYAQ